MEGYRAETYGERIAGVYDERYAGVASGQVDRLVELAAGSPVLEMGIGTGRLALPLAARGVEVEGIDASAAMLEQLRAKPGGSSLRVSIGDFADFDLGRRFGLVFVAFNTLFALTTQQAQVRCFRAAGRHLLPGGHFLVEAFVPDLGRFQQGQHAGVVGVGVDGVELECSIHDPVRQLVTSQHVVIGSGSTRCYPIEIRYAWPAELDLMATLAGLELEHRWAGWQRQPFEAGAQSHVSVWSRPDHR